MDPKSPWASRTLWFNALTFIVLVAGAFGFTGFKPAPEVLEAAAAVVALINIILRYRTNQPIGNRDAATGA